MLLFAQVCSESTLNNDLTFLYVHSVCAALGGGSGLRAVNPTAADGEDDVSSPGMLSASITRSRPHVSSLTSSQHLRSQGCAVHSQKKGLKMSTDTPLLTGPTEDRDP